MNTGRGQDDRFFKTKKDCCGCAACMNACPKKAITMDPDEDGYLYPVADQVLCVECELCKKVCAFQNILVNWKEPLSVYAAINKNQSVLSNSASGGIFAALASLVFAKGGVVFGSAFNDDIEPEHIGIGNPKDMKKIQGSKYVQSSINNTFIEAEQYLKQGKVVLYTGTPCQIAGLKSYLNKDYDNLITADLICHGVPSSEFFKGYIKYLEGKLNGKIIDFKFRDKLRGWGFMEKAVYEKNGAVRKKFIAPITSYYYNYFLHGDIYRESCYECKYAGGSRQGDFTMGDYWGIEKAHPEIDTTGGVSVLLVNSKRGMDLIGSLSEHLILIPSTFEQARAQNEQLSKPISKSNKRETILKMWRDGGYQAVADEYYSKNKQQIILFKIKLLVPQPVKKVIKILLGRG
jgi:coenzyme F420-reducing hydrogenase beta subunit